MENLKIGLLLHFYQPWWQFPKVLAQIVAQCYRPILRLIKEEKGFCFSANINYSLLELLDRNSGENPVRLSLSDSSFADVIEGFGEAVKNGKIELLGSTAYHPIMPLVSQKMQMAQMVTDALYKKISWDIEKNCNGVYLPEMAFSRSILPNLGANKYEWTIIDDEPFRVEYGYVPFDSIALLNGLKIFLRSNYWSNKIAGGELPTFAAMREKMERDIPDWTKNRPAYLILAMDAETFGHHHKGLIEKLLTPMLKEWGSGGLGILTPIEGIGRLFPPMRLSHLENGTWATSENDIREKDFYPLWNSKFNEHHENLWRLVNIALKYARQAGADRDCLKIASSCHWWWISRARWEPKFMMLGAGKAMEVIDKYGSECEKKEGKKIFENLEVLK